MTQLTAAIPALPFHRAWLILTILIVVQVIGAIDQYVGRHYGAAA